MKFFKEFKTFITRGNVLDMAVGVIVGGAFTAIVNALTKNILQPVINWIIAACVGGDALGSAVTILSGSADDLTTAIYIDWGAFISAIINFLLIAFVLFCIVKTINALNDGRKDMKKRKATKEERKEMKAKGLNYYDLDEVKAYRDEKNAKKAAEEAAAKKAADEAAALAAEKERLENPTTEDLLKKIIVLLEKNN